MLCFLGGIAAGVGLGCLFGSNSSDNEAKMKEIEEREKSTRLEIEKKHDENMKQIE